MQSKERMSILFWLFVNWEMTKYVCMVLGVIQSEGSVHGEEERGGNRRKPLQGLGSELKQKAGCRGPCPMAGGRRREDRFCKCALLRKQVRIRSKLFCVCLSRPPLLTGLGVARLLWPQLMSLARSS